MATITFDAAHQKEQARKQLEIALAAYREMLNTFAGDHMRQDAAEAGQVRVRIVPKPQS
jgi:hypothetical protein